MFRTRTNKNHMRSLHLGLRRTTTLVFSIVFGSELIYVVNATGSSGLYGTTIVICDRSWCTAYKWLICADNLMTGS